MYFYRVSEAINWKIGKFYFLLAIEVVSEGTSQHNIKIRYPKNPWEQSCLHQIHIAKKEYLMKL